MAGPAGDGRLPRAGRPHGGPAAGAPALPGGAGGRRAHARRHRAVPRRGARRRPATAGAALAGTAPSPPRPRSAGAPGAARHRLGALAAAGLYAATVGRAQLAARPRTRRAATVRRATMAGIHGMVPLQAADRRPPRLAARRARRRRRAAGGPTAVAEGEPDMTLPPRLRHQRVRQPPPRRRARGDRRPRLHVGGAHPRPPPPRPVRRRRASRPTHVAALLDRARAARASSRPARATCSTRAASTTRRSCATSREPAHRLPQPGGARSPPTWAPTAVSFWSGIRPSTVDADDGVAAAAGRGAATVLEEAERRSVPLGLEPEPGMFVEHAGRRRCGCARSSAHPELLGITLDVGHCVAVEPTTRPPASAAPPTCS